MKTNEIKLWKPVNGYEGFYEINENSQVRSLHKRNYKKIMPQRIDRAGYWTIRLSNRGKDSTVSVHRILGLVFLKNPNNKCCINHIDGNKLNNSLNNLEWVTTSENMKHAYKSGLVVSLPGRCKKIIDKCSGSIFESIKNAADYNMIPYSTCKNYLNGNRVNTTCLAYFDMQAVA